MATMLAQGRTVAERQLWPRMKIGTSSTGLAPQLVVVQVAHCGVSVSASCREAGDLARSPIPEPGFHTVDGIHFAPRNETMVETVVCWYLQGNHLFQSFLGAAGFRPSTVSKKATFS